MANGLFNLKQVMQAVQQGGWSAQKTPAVEYLVVAGGGGGGAYYGAGGGAGGLLQGLNPVPNGQTLLVTIGGGGNGASGAGNGTNGSNSVFGQISPTGGGGGVGGSASSVKNGVAGGSGGGGQNYDAGGAAAVGGAGVFGQGNAGSSGTGGGGGGAGTPGYRAGNTTKSGGGGAGIVSTIVGTATAYAGGGAGAGGSIPGGVGGGGAANVAGTANTGGGGGGDSGSNGGSGIVIVSYPDVYAAASATTGSPTVSTSGSGGLSFDGSTQYLTYASNAAWALGTTFTLEFWTYPTAFSSSNKRYFDTSNNGAGGFSLRTTNTGVVALDVSATGQTTTTLSLSTWTHVAVVVTSGTLAIYFNGVAQTLTGGGLTGINVTGTLALTVGNFATAATYAYQGYLSNVRIVKGVAVYTGNFTPSTVPLQATQPAGTNIAAITSTSTGLLLNSVSGSPLADSSTNSFSPNNAISISPSWNALSPFTVTGYKNRVYSFTSSGSITF